MPNPKLSSLTIPVDGVLTTFDLGSGSESGIPSGARLVKITQNDYNQLTPDEKMDPDVVYFVEDGGEAASVKLLSITNEPSKTGYDSSNYIFDTTGLTVELQTILKGNTTSTDVTSECVLSVPNGTDLSTYLNGQATNASIPIKVTYTDSDGNEYSKTFTVNVFGGGSGGGGEGEPSADVTYRLGVYKKPNHAIYGTDDPILDLTGYTIWLYADPNNAYDGTWDYVMNNGVPGSHIDVTDQCTFDPPNGTDLSSRIAALLPEGTAYLPIEATYTYNGVTYDTRYPAKLYNGNANGPAKYVFKTQDRSFGLYGTDDFLFDTKTEGVSGTMWIRQGPYKTGIALSMNYFKVGIEDGTDMRVYDPGVDYTTCTPVPVKVTATWEGAQYVDYGVAYYLNARTEIYELHISGAPKQISEAGRLSFYQLTDTAFDTSVLAGSFLYGLKWNVNESVENNGSYRIRSKITNISPDDIKYTLIPDGTIVTSRHTIKNGHNMAQYAPTTSGGSQVYQIEAMITYDGYTTTDTFYCTVWNVDDPEFKPE